MFEPELLNALKQAKHVMILTGAGVSAESGIPTFRGAMTGLWEQYDPTQLASVKGFLADPALVWGWYEWRRQRVLAAQPNAAHIAIAALEQLVPKFTLITQNVDDLHERGGSSQVLHLHGSLHHPRCMACEQPYKLSIEAINGSSNAQRIEPPHCQACGNSIRPGVVWFGETVSLAEWEVAVQAAGTCDVFISVGTSGLVWPAARLPQQALCRGITMIQINPDETGLDSSASFNLRGKAGIVLPQLVGAAFDSK